MDWQKDRKRYKSINEGQAKIRKKGLKEICVILNKQEIEILDTGGQMRNRLR